MDTPSNGVGTILTSDKCLSARSRTQTSPGLNTSFLPEKFMNSGLRVAVNRYKTISFSLEAFFSFQIATKSKSLNGCLSHLNIFFCLSQSAFAAQFFFAACENLANDLQIIHPKNFKFPHAHISFRVFFWFEEKQTPR